MKCLVKSAFSAVIPGLRSRRLYPAILGLFLSSTSCTSLGLALDLNDHRPSPGVNVRFYEHKRLPSPNLSMTVNDWERFVRRQQHISQVWMCVGRVNIVSFSLICGSRNFLMSSNKHCSFSVRTITQLRVAQTRAPFRWSGNDCLNLYSQVYSVSPFVAKLMFVLKTLRSAIADSLQQFRHYHLMLCICLAPIASSEPDRSARTQRSHKRVMLACCLRKR